MPSRAITSVGAAIRDSDVSRSARPAATWRCVDVGSRGLRSWLVVAAARAHSSGNAV